MATSISTPASLATFNQPHASSSKLPHVALSPVEGGEGSYAVAAVQGDGIWTYDLRTMRPTTSFTVPPSTTFAFPPISFYSKSRGKAKEKAQTDDMDVDAPSNGGGTLENRRVTAVVLEKGEGMAKSAKGKVLWLWTGDEADHETVTLEPRVVGLHRIANSDRPILAIHSATSFSLLSTDSSIPPFAVTLASKTALSGDLLSTKVQTTSAEWTSLILVDSSGRWANVTLEGSGNATRAVLQKEGRLTDEECRFQSASISSDGVITGIDTENRLVSRHISGSPHSPYPTLVHAPTPALSLSLPTSGKPLAIIPTSHPTPSVLLTIPSATVPALLNSVPISTSSSNTTITHLALLGQTAPNVYVVGCVLHHGSSEDGGRSVVYTFEVSLPERGIGLNALLGTQARTEEYLSLAHDGSTKGAANGHVGKEDEKMVTEVEGLLSKGDTKAATTRLETYLSSHQPTEQVVKKVVQVIFGTALPGLSREGESESKKRGPYSGKMVKALLQKHLIQDEMIKGGVVGAALLPLEDWDNIFIALPLLRTLPSSTLISLIKASADPAKSAKTPSIESVLAAILALPTPAPTYRLELKRGLNVEEATAVLEVLTTWAEAWVSNNSKGIEWDVSESVSDKTSSADTSSIPTLEAVLAHSSHLLDSHTPLFLGHPPAYSLLSRMQAALEPLLLMQADYRALRAPLDAVLTLSKRAERNREERQKKSQLASGAYGKRGQTSTSAGRAGEGMGEAKVGKWKVEDFAF